MGKGKKGNATWRLWAVVAALAFASLVVVGRLVQLQILDHSDYAREARQTHITEQVLSERRGALLDRNGYPLAASKDSFDVMVERHVWLGNPTRAITAAEAISEITGVPPQEMLDIVLEVDVFEVPVARNLDFQLAMDVRRLGFHGVRLLQSSHRLYPEGNLATQLLGFVGRDNTGLTGLEADLEEILGGSKGRLTFEQDGLGNQLALGSRREVPPQPGANVALSIDRFIQRIVERELEAAIKKHEAAGGTIIVVQPQTGEILAMASHPAADIANPDLSDESKLALFRNRAITDMYEPGSVFKLVTAAIAIDLGLVGPGTWWYDDGVVNVDGWSIYNWDFSANADQTVTQIISKSLNTGAAWLAGLSGPERFYEYVSRFGFGDLTGVNLSGEVEGRVRTPYNDPDWRSVDMATNSFGQGMAATPLQVVMSVATIANDGLAMRPQVVREILWPNQPHQRVEPEPLDQVISPETARTLREMMGVTVDGIPREFLDVQGYRVGGKTGTANISSDTGGYKPDAYISSFVGVAPLDDPVLAILVKIDEPKGVPWGTVVAAPAFGRIVQEALAYMKVPPSEPALVINVQPDPPEETEDDADEEEPEDADGG